MNIESRLLVASPLDTQAIWSESEWAPTAPAAAATTSIAVQPGPAIKR